MALFKVSIKQSGLYNGCKVKKGMEVEVPYNGFAHNLTGTVQGKELVNNSFTAKYGVDVGRANALTSLYLDVVKIN